MNSPRVLTLGELRKLPVGSVLVRSDGYLFLISSRTPQGEPWFYQSPGLSAQRSPFLEPVHTRDYYGPVEAIYPPEYPGLFFMLLDMGGFKLREDSGFMGPKGPRKAALWIPLPEDEAARNLILSQANAQFGAIEAAAKDRAKALGFSTTLKSFDVQGPWAVAEFEEVASLAAMRTNPATRQEMLKHHLQDVEEAAERHRPDVASYLLDEAKQYVGKARKNPARRTSGGAVEDVPDEVIPVSPRVEVQIFKAGRAFYFIDVRDPEIDASLLDYGPQAFHGSIQDAREEGKRLAAKAIDPPEQYYGPKTRTVKPDPNDPSWDYPEYYMGSAEDQKWLLDRYRQMLSDLEKQRNHPRYAFWRSDVSNMYPLLMDGRQRWISFPRNYLPSFRVWR